MNLSSLNQHSSLNKKQGRNETSVSPNSKKQSKI